MNAMKLTTVPYLLGTLGEESGEIQQAIGKILRFGLYDQHKEKEPNFRELQKEVHDLFFRDSIFSSVPFCGYNSFYNCS